MLNIIDILNNNGIPENALLISFDGVTMFPSIRNESGINSVERLTYFIYSWSFASIFRM